MTEKEYEGTSGFMWAMNVLEKMDNLLEKQREAIRNGDFNALFPLGNSLEECRSEFEISVGGLLSGGSSNADDNPDDPAADRKKALAEKLEELKRRNEEIIVELDNKLSSIKKNLITVSKGFQITGYYKNMLIKFNNLRGLDRMG